MRKNVKKVNDIQIWSNEEGKYHRLDGPAIDCKQLGMSFWYVNGNHITDDVEEWMTENNIMLPFNPEQTVEFSLRWM